MKLLLIFAFIIGLLSTSTFAASQGIQLSYHKKHYDYWINYLGKKDKERFMRHLVNAEAVKSTVFKILKQEGVPQDLFYVGLIESGYNRGARSHAQAVGPWQFIRGTALRYGLKVNKRVDERTDIVKSTRAAARYLKDLHNIFSSWELALCAYNAGEYRIINAIRKGKTRSYKRLVEMKLIPTETALYVPKLAAARSLMKNKSRYGLTPRQKRVEARYDVAMD